MSKPYGVTVFCDDIREELSGKHTFVGVYGNTLLINSARPATLPILSAAAFVVIPNEYQYENFIYRLKLMKTMSDEGTVLWEQEQKIKRSKTPGQITRQVIMVTFSPIEIADNVSLASRAYFDDEEIRLGVLAVRFTPNDAAANNRPKSAKPGG